jgi:hypothetical protein
MLSMTGATDAFMAAARERLAADGGEVSKRTSAGGTAVVAWHCPRRVLSRIEIFTYLFPVDEATPKLFSDFARAVSLAAQADQRRNPVWTALSAIPVLVAERVTPEAREAALSRKPYKDGMKGRNPGRFVWPAIADLAAGERYFYDGPIVIGRFGSGLIRERLMVAVGPGGDGPETT